MTLHVPLFLTGSADIADLTIFHSACLDRSTKARTVKMKETDSADAETDHLQRLLQRGSPFGSETWTTKTAQFLGLTSTINPRGQPSARKEK